MSLALDEFYANLRAVGVSAMTGEGLDDFLGKLDEATEEYESDYKVEYERLKAAKVKAEKEAAENKGESGSKKTTKDAVPLRSNLIESAPMDDESEEERDFEFENERKDEDSFASFIDQHSKKT